MFNEANLVDALPYIDQGYDQDVQIKQMVLYMIEEETKRFRNNKNYLEHLGDENLHQFETDLMKNELERIEKEEPMPKFDVSRYELPKPSIGKQKDLASWQKSLENSFAQLESQNFRILNLKLLDSYGPESWKTYNNILDQLVQEYKKKLIDTKRKIQETNYERKTSQEKAGDKLKHLEKNWVNLVSKNFEIEQACLNLENELKMLKKYHQFDRPGQENNENEPKAKRQKTDCTNQDDDENEE